jgi:adenylate cyclase
VQADIVRRAVGAVAVKLARYEEERALAKPTDSLVAYDYILRGREVLTHTTQEKNDEARELFQRAIGLDPNYAGAYAALGGSHFEAAVSGWTEFREAELERAETLAQKALALDLATTSAYRLLANISISRKRYDLALGQIDRALEINPNDAASYRMRGSVLVWAGRAAEGLRWLEGALRFDSSTRSFNLCHAYYFLGRYGEAVEACDRALAGNPGRHIQVMARPVLAAAYSQLGRDQDASGERAIIAHLWPFFDAERFAGQFGTQEARDHMLDGLKKAGFR